MSAPPVQLTAHATVLLWRACTNRPTATMRTPAKPATMSENPYVTGVPPEYRTGSSA
ncbi:hypothetical protein [Halobellus marinus]|uniref:hypothetical protein n=1 Tax=Halobellus TaxID=1073986 RepID=UPI0028ACFE2D|nr:hypothetical protein [Halobellus sp. DFY28]